MQYEIRIPRLTHEQFNGLVNVIEKASFAYHPSQGDLKPVAQETIKRYPIQIESTGNVSGTPPVYTNIVLVSEDIPEMHESTCGKLVEPMKDARQAQMVFKYLSGLFLGKG